MSDRLLSVCGDAGLMDECFGRLKKSAFGNLVPSSKPNISVVGSIRTLSNYGSGTWDSGQSHRAAISDFAHRASDRR